MLLKLYCLTIDSENFVILTTTHSYVLLLFLNYFMTLTLYILIDFKGGVVFFYL